MERDLRVTPTNDVVPDNPAALGRLTVDRLAMEVAGELGVDPGGTASGLDPQRIRRYEAETHSPNQRGSN